MLTEGARAQCATLLAAPLRPRAPSQCAVIYFKVLGHPLGLWHLRQNRGRPKALKARKVDLQCKGASFSALPR